MKIGIAGAGLMGRLLAWSFARSGCDVSLFDREISGQNSAAFVAGGRLAPYSECMQHDRKFCELSQQAMRAWYDLLPHFVKKSWFYQSGSVVLAQQNDLAELDQFVQHVNAKTDCIVLKELNEKIEQELAQHAGYFFEQEAYLDARCFLQECLRDTQNIRHYDHVNVRRVQANTIVVEGGLNRYFDWVFDCRGFGGVEHFPELRCVRGEIIRLEAPVVNITRPIRLLHPRYHLYIVPRPNHHYLIGASEIESPDQSPISVRSTLELLSCACSVHSGFYEARIVETNSALRATLPDNMPQLVEQNGFTAINGLYRHGFLFAPLMLQKIQKGVFAYASVP